MAKKIPFLTIFVIFTAAASLAQRVVLIEQFTNSGCPPCAASTPSVLNYVNNNSQDVVAIAYHTSFPYSDSMYFENPAESNARVSFYSVVGVPYSVVDGNYYSNSSSNFIPVIASTINSRKTIPNQYAISNIASSVNANVLSTKIAFESLIANNLNDSLRAHIVVIEKNVLKSSYAASPGANSETNYEYVMRKMLPNQNGSFLFNRNLNGKDTLTLNWNLQKIKNNSEIRIVAFVQNIITKEIYMAKLFSTTLLNNISELPENKFSFDVFPNPSSGLLTINPLNLKNTANILVTNLLGEIIYSDKITNNTLKEINLSNYSKGIYFITIKDNDNSISKKIILE
ncbi:MAG: T9SS type A sorting domain-containing protein [Bacteroidota bacterium]|nr:T9SS type A sorting domain-containing protein [Bacteroidota bacterium]